MGFNTFPCNPYPISTEELNKGNNDDLNTRVSTLEGEVSDLNSTKANQITIAPFFNAEASYSVGDLVYYNGLTYRCTNDHEGEWDADDFAATTISSELDALKSGLANYQTIAKIVEITGTTDANGRITGSSGSGFNKIPLSAWRVNSSNIVNIYRYVNSAGTANTINFKVFDSETGAVVANTLMTIKWAYLDTTLI